LEKRLIHGDVFQGLNTFSGFDGQNSVDQEKWIPVWQVVHDFPDVVCLHG
jgi:hypothetical protein